MIAKINLCQSRTLQEWRDGVTTAFTRTRFRITSVVLPLRKTIMQWLQHTTTIRRRFDGRDSDSDVTLLTR